MTPRPLAYPPDGSAPRRPHCPVCGDLYQRRGARAVTRDHILPREYGGADRMRGDTGNIRWMCGACNMLRAMGGHCLLAAVCAIIVGRATGRRPHLVMHEWARWSRCRMPWVAA